MYADNTLNSMGHVVYRPSRCGVGATAGSLFLPIRYGGIACGIPLLASG